MLKHSGLFLLTCFGVVSCACLHAQDDAQALLKRVQAKAVATRSMSGHIVLTRRGDKGKILTLTGTATLLKPNFAEIKLAGDDPEPLRAAYSDGRDLYTFSDAVDYSVAAIDKRGLGIREPWWAMPLSYFFSQSLNPFGAEPDATAVYKMLPDETREGKPVHVIGVTGKEAMGYTARFTIDAMDRIVGSEVNFGSGPQAAFFKAELSEMKTGVTLTPAAFRFHEPAGAKRKAGKLVDAMLPAGETAPEFKLPAAADGTQQTLAGIRQGAKATLVNFWFVNCAPCRIEFPDFEKLYAQLHAKGLNIVAIDKSDDSAAVMKVVRSDGLTFPVLLGGQTTAKSVFADYRTMDTFPATYLLDAQGRIVWRSASVDTDGLRKALAAQGVQ